MSLAVPMMRSPMAIAAPEPQEEDEEEDDDEDQEEEGSAAGKGGAGSGGDRGPDEDPASPSAASTAGPPTPADEKLAQALAGVDPGMRLKDLLSQEVDIGDCSLGSLLRAAGACAKRQLGAEAASGTEGEDLERVEEESDSEEGNDGDEAFGAPEEEEDDEEYPPPFNPAVFLRQLQGDEQQAQNMFRMLMMLNAGLQYGKCRCPPGGPHMCMSPAASQLASTIHSLAQSLNASYAASMVQTAQQSRRQSVEKRRRRSARGDEDEDELGMELHEGDLATPAMSAGALAAGADASGGGAPKGAAAGYGGRAGGIRQSLGRASLGGRRVSFGDQQIAGDAGAEGGVPPVPPAESSADAGAGPARRISLGRSAPAPSGHPASRGS